MISLTVLLFISHVGSQATTPILSLARNLSAAFDAPWNVQAEAACSLAASSILYDSATNPTAMMACYNVARLENVTGLFAGDIRLYGLGATALPIDSSIQINVDFGKAGNIVNFTDNAIDLSSSSRKRGIDPAIWTVMEVAKRQAVDQQIPKIPKAPSTTANSNLKTGITNKPGDADFDLPTPGPPILVPSSGSSARSSQASQSTTQSSAVTGLNKSNQPTSPISTVTPGSFATVASPREGTKAIPASALNSPTSSTFQQQPFIPAILPGETFSGDPIQASLQQAGLRQSPPSSIESLGALQVRQAAVPVTSTTGSIQTAVASVKSGKQIEVFQFVGQLDVALALSNPDGSGLLSALQPSIKLLVTSTSNQTKTTLVSIPVRAYLIGIQGINQPARFPGRQLLGQDQSTSVVGIFVTSIYTLLFVITLMVGQYSRYSMRRNYRAIAKRVGKEFAS